MPNYAADFSTEYLTKEQIGAALLALPKVLESLLGDHEVVAYYGWATNIHGDLQWKPMSMRTTTMEFFIEDSLEHRIFVVAESDMLFTVPDKRLEILFCHESDLHLDGVDSDFLRSVMSAEPFLGFRWYTKQELEAQRSEPRDAMGPADRNLNGGPCAGH